MPATPARQRTTYRQVLAVSEFRVLFTITLLRSLATTAEILGLSVLVYSQTGSVLLSAVAYGIGFLPQLVGGALFTSLADRLQPRAVLTLLALVRAVPGAAIGLISMPVAVMLVLVAVTACFDPVANAASSGIVPSLLDGDRYVLGRSMMNAASFGAQILGLGVGGAILVALSPRQLLVVAAAVLVAASVAARLGLTDHPPRATGGARRGTIGRTFAGNRTLLADRRIRALMLAQWLPAWFVTGGESLIVAYTGALGRPESAASVLLVALPVGMLTGEIAIGRFCRPHIRERLCFPMATLMGLPLLAFAIPISVPVGAALLAATGAGFGYQLGLQQRFLDAIPHHLQGQAFGLRTTGLMGGQGAGPVAAGGLAAAFGPGAAITATGAATVLAGLWLHDTLTGHSDHHREHPQVRILE